MSDLKYTHFSRKEMALKSQFVSRLMIKVSVDLPTYFRLQLRRPLIQCANLSLCAFKCYFHAYIEELCLHGDGLYTTLSKFFVLFPKYVCSTYTQSRYVLRNSVHSARLAQLPCAGSEQYSNSVFKS